MGIKTTDKNRLSIFYPELCKEWHPILNGNLNPFDFVIGSAKNVFWFCKKGHIWKTSIRSRTQKKTGCSCCSGHKVCMDNCLATLRPDLIKEWSLKNKITPFDVTLGSLKDVLWECLICCREYQSKIYDRTKEKGSGCPFCSGRKACSDNCLAVFYPNLVLEWHPTLNETLTPYDVVCGSHISVSWICKFGHIWKTSIASRSKSKSGCPVCSGRKACLSNSLFTLNPEIAKEWDYEVNGDLKPENFKCKSEKMVGWTCKKGHKWNDLICNRVKGRSCPCCRNRKACKENCLETLRPDLALEWDYEKNFPLTPKDVPSKSYKNVGWQCIKKLHKWDMRISERNKGYGCPCCSGRRVCKDNCLLTINPKICEEWDYIRNKELRPENFTANNGMRVWWKCKKCGYSWKTTIASRNSGCGCRICNESKGERKIATILNTIKIDTKREWTNHNCRDKNILPFDFYIEDLNSCIEYQGEQHYKSIEIWGGQKALESNQKRDLIKYNYCISNNIPLLRIPYWEFENIEEIVLNFIHNIYSYSI